MGLDVHVGVKLLAGLNSYVGRYDIEVKNCYKISKEMFCMKKRCYHDRECNTRYRVIVWKSSHNNESNSAK